MNKLNLSLYILLIAFTWASCETNDEDPNNGPAQNETDVLVICEGAFQGNSASLSAYSSESQSVSSQVFEMVNGYGPGDVMQGAREFEGRLYLVLNNSGKIEVVDEASLEAEAPINGLISPRDILFIDSEKAYVSNLFSNSVQIVDLVDKVVSGAIEIDGWSEGMIEVNGKAFVSKSNGDKVIVIDVMTDQVIDSIPVTPGPVNMVLDMEGMIWLATNGNFGATTPRIHRIDPQSHTVIGSFDIPAPHSYTIKVALNGDSDQVYILNNDLYTMFIGDNEISTDAIVSTGVSYYGLGIHPMTGDLYLTDAGDFTSSGNVERYTMSGTLIDEFEVGIAPNGLHFR